jgi:uncharacterized iron-regulated protein
MLLHKPRTRLCPLLAAALLMHSQLGQLWAQQPGPPVRAALWIDALRGEPLAQAEMIEDVEKARVTYLGEYHTIQRHHQLEVQLLEALVQRGRRVVLAMEQFESAAQPGLDRFNSGTIDLDTLVQQTELPKRWPGYTNYLALLSSARTHGVPVLALNARAETIRAVGRSGLAGLPAEQRAELPESIQLDDPVYERLLTQTLAVHMAFDPKKLRPVFEAQVARDETMAARLSEFLASSAGRERQALVICGRGHCEFGLGTPARVERRMPGITQRVILFSESGDLQLSEEERKQAREIEIPHSFLKDLGRPAADYFHVAGRTPAVE